MTTAGEKDTFLLRLITRPEAVEDVFTDVTGNGETYVVKATNTVQNSRSPEPFRSVAVIMPYERYEEMKQALAAGGG